MKMDTQSELWKDVEGYEGIYKVSNYGNIKSIPRNGTVKTEKILKGAIDNNGYRIIGMCKNNSTRTKTFHRIVALAWIENPNNKPQVNHINGIKTDNRVINLEWNTASENKRHSIDSLGKKRSRESYMGVMKPVLKLDKFGNIISEYDSIREASRLNKINNGNLHNHLNGLRKSAGGFLWKYKK